MAGLDIAGAAGKVRRMASDPGSKQIIGWLLTACGILLTVVGLLVGHITTIQEMAEAHAQIKEEVHEKYVPREILAVQLVNMNDSLVRLSREVESLRKEIKASGGGR